MKETYPTTKFCTFSGKILFKTKSPQNPIGRLFRCILIKENLFFLLLFLSATLLANPTHQYGFITVPVADLVGAPLTDKGKERSIEQLYNTIPHSGDSDACPRLHQAIFNEMVRIIAEKGSEVKIQILTSYYLTPEISTPQTEFWTLRSNVLPLKKLKASKIDLSKFPDPLTFSDPPIPKHNKKTLVLIEPFHDPITEKSYSVGTRFVISEDNDTMPYVKVYIFDPLKNRFRSTKIARTKFIKPSDKSKEERIQLFLTTLRAWANAKDGFIPYVFGGWSWTTLCNKDSTYHKDDSGKSYMRPSSSAPTGMDCVGVIGRAAEIAGLPFHFKNTTTMKLKMRSLKKGEPLEEGDIIWYSGHVIVVSNIKKGLVIEARGYSLGFGKLQEIHLGSYFKGIKTFDALLSYYYKGKHLPILDVDGKHKRNKRCEILKMSSIWDVKHKRT